MMLINNLEALRSLVSTLRLKEQKTHEKVDNNLINYLKVNYKKINPNLMLYLNNYIFSNIEKLTNSKILYYEEQEIFILKNYFDEPFIEIISLTEDHVLPVRKDRFLTSSRQITYSTKEGMEMVNIYLDKDYEEHIDVLDKLEELEEYELYYRKHPNLGHVTKINKSGTNITRENYISSFQNILSLNRENLINGENIPEKIINSKYWETYDQIKDSLSIPMAVRKYLDETEEFYNIENKKDKTLSDKYISKGKIYKIAKKENQNSYYNLIKRNKDLIDSFEEQKSIYTKTVEIKINREINEKRR